MTRCIVNDIDGAATHTVDAGDLADVRARADDRLRKQIDQAIANGGVAVETFTRDGEEYTTKVIVTDD